MACLTKYSRNAAWHLTLQLLACASHVAFSRESLLVNFLRASHEIALIFIACLILHQLNTNPNIIKSHKIQENKLMQLQHLLSWNKANTKHSCRSQLYVNQQHNIRWWSGWNNLYLLKDKYHFTNNWTSTFPSLCIWTSLQKEKDNKISLTSLIILSMSQWDW